MNARVSIFEKNELLTTMFTQCVGCPVPYTMLERGEARAAMGTTRAPGAENPQIRKVELRKLDGFDGDGEPDDSVCPGRPACGNNCPPCPTKGQKDLTMQNIIQLEFTSYDLMRKIGGGAVIRIYLYPLTSWAVQDGTCSAILIGMNPSDPSAKLSCGASSLLPIDEMVQNMTMPMASGGAIPANMTPSPTPAPTPFFADASSIANRNTVLSIQLPRGYEITSTKRPQLQVAGINLPEEAWFPTRIMVSVHDVEGRAHFSTAHGFLMKSVAHEKLLMPRLVSDGPVKAGKFPFRSPKDDDRPDDNAAIAPSASEQLCDRIRGQ
jgi:hypothetical protein